MTPHRTPRNTANILRILTFLSEQQDAVAAQTISQRLGIPRSTVYELLGTLAEYGYAVPLSISHRYSLGTRAFELSSAYSRQKPLTRLGQALLRTLVDRIGEAAHLAVLQGTDVVYLAEERAPHRPLLITESGVRLPAAQTASGRALMAWLPRAQIRAMYPHANALPDGAEGSPKTPAELLRMLGETAERGYATEIEEVTPGLASVVVPVLGRDSWPIAAMGITFELERHPDLDAALDWLLPPLRRFAAELGRRLGAQA
ncbi:MAG: IclR family transcriptional regulator [Microbacteriaceae bacterium]|jgi:DNA-binding IclR family transcriptional regulator|nr:IclR family transcriptional regulator [Microbacteriaceae bacterium]MCI1207413.1 IclR family transcriptional regulator [Microbacteriaceae bacterium]